MDVYMLDITYKNREYIGVFIMFCNFLNVE